MPDKRAPGSGNSPLQESSGTPASATRRSPLSSSLDRAVAPALQVVPHALCRQYPIINNLPRTDESPVIIDVMNTFGSSDTSRAAERVLFDLARQAPAWRKVDVIKTQRGRLQGAAVLAVADLVERALKEASSE
jgi:hypothetical protein